MDAKTQLSSISSLLNQHGVEAVLIGCAAAALQGAPVTTDDFDFYFRPTPLNLKKLEEIARELGTNLKQPHYPLSSMYRISSPGLGVQVDMMGKVFGVRSFESVRSRATRAFINDCPIMVASLRDVISMKKAAGRPKDLAVMPILVETLREEQTKK
jgi:predicted nucleotidyltransferase